MSYRCFWLNAFNPVIRVLKVLHWLNIDTALGVVFTSLYVANFLTASIPIGVALTLFLAVLIIYNFDHLIDAKSIKANAKTARHRFYQNNLYVLSVYQLALLIILSVLVWYLPISIIRAGVILGLVTIIYFVLLFIIFPRRFLLKEIMISLVFSLAIFLPSVYSKTPVQLYLNGIFLWSEILLLAIANTFIFSWYDYEIDDNEGHTSISTAIGRRTVGFLINGLFIMLGLLVIINLFIFTNWTNQFVILLMMGLLYYSYRANKKLYNDELYRLAGDAVFLLPIVSLIQ